MLLHEAGEVLVAPSVECAAERIAEAFLAHGAAPAEERRAVMRTMGSKDQQEGMRAFLEKRPPRFNRDSEE